jgi:D-alanyl-D-alanine carboxypeptidase
MNDTAFSQLDALSRSNIHSSASASIFEPQGLFPGAPIISQRSSTSNSSLKGTQPLVGSSGNDRLIGKSGNDRLTGKSGNDYLDGGAGIDQILGGQGNDTLIDYEGSDLLTGGSGQDIFGVGGALSQSASKITDFKIGADQIKVLRLGAEFSNLTFQASQGDTLIFDRKQPIAKLLNIKPNQLTPNSFLFGNAPLARTLQTNLNQSLAENPNATGLSAVIFAPDGTVWQGFAGLSNRENPTPVNKNALFGIGSITKPIVATTILQLQEEGKLNLNNTVKQWLPDLAKTIPNSDRITIQQLLGHTSGIRDYLDEPALRAQFFNDAKGALSQTYTAPDLLQFIKDKPALAKPGKSFFYSNSNYILLGAIVEKATGSTLASQLRARIFDPLGMTHTFYAPQEKISRGEITRTYTDLNDDGELDYLNEVDETRQQGLSWAGAAGGIVSTAPDVAKFAQALFQGQLLAPKTLKKMINKNSDLLAGISRPPGSAPTGTLERDRYGLGVESGSVTGIGNFLRHNGATIGWGSEMTYLPDRQITAIVLGSQPTPTGASDLEDTTFSVVSKNLRSTVQSYPSA